MSTAIDPNSSGEISTIDRPSPLKVFLLGVGLLLLILVTSYLFLKIWPAGMAKDTSGNAMQTINLWRDGWSIRISLDVQLILVAMLSGGLGSFVHAATSFIDYVGNKRLGNSWVWWYILRPFIGMTLATIFYVAIRGGFLSTGSDAGNLNPYGIAALGGLVGMFSKQATDKLNELFDTIFRAAPGAGDAQRNDSLSHPVPTISDVEPKSLVIGAASIKVTGTGFVQGSAVQINGVSRETEYVSETTLTAKLLPEDVTSAGILELTVFNPSPGGGASAPIKVDVYSGTDSGK